MPSTPTTALSTAVRLTGADVLGVLHRISTNALEDLAPGRARATLFCDFRGRLLHRAVVARTLDGAVWLVRDDAPGALLLAFVDRHVFREDVRLEDHSAAAAWTVVNDPSIQPGAVLERDGTPFEVRPEDGPALRLGGSIGAAHERDRIDAGRAAHGHEIVETFTPYEVGLSHEVHLDKGCFTGQEALMRLVTYQSVRRRLARVGGPGTAPATSADLKSAGKAAGVLTSTTAARDASRWIGLAVVKNVVLDSGAPLQLADGTTIDQIEALPVTCPLGRP